MAPVIVYGAPAPILESGNVAGHILIRLAYEDGVTDVDQWLTDVAAEWRALGDGPHTLRAVVLRYQARPTGAALGIREAMESRLVAAGARLVLVVPPAEVTWTQGQIDANPSRVRTYATTAADLQAWIDAHTWPIPLDPALGGSGRRIGGGRHVPWGLCIDDPVPSQWTPPPE